MERDIAAAARAVQDWMGLKAMNQADLARAAQIDNGTLGDFLAGRRWPQTRTRARIESALELTPGFINQVASGFLRISVTPLPQDADSEQLPVGSGVDPELLTQLADADPAAIEAVRAVLRAARRGD
jgi:transcriptional regulator with XRE-family HTH domain